MNYQHDPLKQVNYLQQCLSNDKRPLGFFIGAGCPMSIKDESHENNPPLIPDIMGITKLVCDELAECEECAAALKKVQGHFTQDGHEECTVEDILSHIRALRSVAGNDMVRDLCAKDLDILDKKICDMIQSVVEKELPNTLTPYHRLALWVDAVQREKPVELFTTNYDLLMEQALEECQVPYFDGFSGTRRPFFDIRAIEEDLLPLRWARLWKLHGSTNWYQVDNVKGVFRGTNGHSGGTRRVIHPSHLKYEESRRMPFLAMIDRFRAFLKQSSVALIVCGYSFKDEHINEVMVQGLQSNQTSMAFALLFGKLENYKDAVKLACGRSNLTLLARDGAIVNGQKIFWAENASTEVPQGKEFSLGDFAEFGDFLHELIGPLRQGTEATNVK